MKKLKADKYELLKEAYEKRPGVYKYAAEYAGCTDLTAKKAWLAGWPRDGMRPIKEIHEEVQLKARAQIEAERAAKRAASEKEREDAHKNAVESLKQEGQMVLFSRTQSIQNLTVAIELARSARALLPELKSRVEIEAEKLKIWNHYEKLMLEAQQNNTPIPAQPSFAKPPLSFVDHVNWLEKVARINAQIVETAGKAMELERMHIGKPAHIIGVELNDRTDVTVSELQARLAAAEKALNKGADMVIKNDHGEVKTSVGKVIRLAPAVSNGSNK